MSQRTCSIDGCESPHQARGLCISHYNRWHAHGDPTAGWVGANECLHCGGCLPAKSASGPSPLYCSRVCRSRAWRAKNRDTVNAQLRARNAEKRIAKRCPCCGDEFTPELTPRQKYCSKRCSKRMQNAARRAKTRGAYVEDLHWRMLYDEDGPACHICGYDVDPTDLSGPSSPTIDHIVALAAGGKHERSNTALAHRYCNSVKGARDVLSVA